jgi:predicted AlkP superfamily phosphohydrolase/phosphomutase
MSAGLLVIGLDAAECTLIDRLVAAGDLPVLARLSETADRYRLANAIDLLPGAIWPELSTGRSCGKEGRYAHLRQLHTGEAGPRPIEEGEVDPDAFWTVAAEAGRRVAVADVPMSVRAPGLNGLQLLEWGIHDRKWGPRSEPPELLDELRAVHGDYEVWSCETHGGTVAGYDELRDALLKGVAQKTELLLDLLERESWDLFACAFTEMHCVGHQFWRFLEPESAFEKDAPALADAIRSVYRAVDAAVGALIDAAGEDARVIVFASHGMGPYTGGPQLLPEVLIRLGFGSGGGTAAQVRSRLPRSVRKTLRMLTPAAARKRLQSAAGSLPVPLASPLTRAVALENNRCGAIRLNLRGREPFGSVDPADADALLDELRREIVALRDPASGEPIVTEAVTATEAFGPDHHPDVPDLMVSFRADIGVIDGCRSERVGTVERPVSITHRTGDHTSESRLWLRMPDATPAPEVGDGNVLDLAPTVLELLDVPLPAWLDGSPLGHAGAERGTRAPVR